MAKKLRSVALLMLLVYLCALFFSSGLAASDTGKTVKVTVDGARLREKPSTSSTILAEMKLGTKLTIRDVKNDWFQVKYDGKTGWVRSDMVSTPSSSSSASSTKKENVGKQAKVIKSDVNVRKEASTSSKVLTTLKKGAVVDITGTSGQWYKVRGGGKNGYIRTDMLSVITPKIPSATVKAAQNDLRKLNFYSPQWAVDGHLGNATYGAIKAFQRAYGLTPDGVVGEQTLETHKEATKNGGNKKSAALVGQKGDVILCEWFNYMKFVFPQRTAPVPLVDVATGERFMVRAMSCGNHADIETYTQQDTSILYRINGSKWSWTPRAVWVYLNGKIYAGSINVMPHGGDTLPDNGMKGQICLHFLHSRNHNTGLENRDMQAAVLLAFEKGLQAPPYEKIAGDKDVISDPGEDYEVDPGSAEEEEGGDDEDDPDVTYD